MIDLTRAVLVMQSDLTQHDMNFVVILRDLVEERTGIRWRIERNWPVEDRPGNVDPSRPAGEPVIAVGLRSSVQKWASPMAGSFKENDGPKAPEGFQIMTTSRLGASPAAVAVAGNDSRGLLFGIGRLLRELRMERGRVLLPDSFQVHSAPRLALRGHQLGYRPKTNSYDAWNAGQWLGYIRDLALFGTNAIEILPPHTDDDADSPHFSLPPIQMMTRMSHIADTFGLDVWIWFPAMQADYTSQRAVEADLDEWKRVCQATPRLDAVFVPGGDPGHTRPKVLLDFLEKATRTLHEFHPKAQMWVSPQGFNAAWMDEFLGLLKAEPDWFTGVVFGPQVRMNLPELRKALPARYPIRGYPDITHSRQCQHPVPDWDLAFAATEGRESINPRPRAQAEILKAYLNDTVGFITYSEGCNDDVNKFVWSALGWDPDADVVEVLRQYGRVFIDGRHADAFAQALLGLERNWSGPLLTNSGVETTLRQLQDMERSAGPALRLNWRFQQALYRAYYDAYLRDRLVYENALESRAMEWLRRAKTVGSGPAMSRAEAVMERALTEPVGLDRRARVFELGEALFQSVRMQLSVPRYQAIAAERGANLDTIDAPLNNRVWLSGQFAAIRALATEPERLRALDALVSRTDPGPGGFYDALGDPANRPHLLEVASPGADPLLSHSAFVGFGLRTDWPTAWRRYAQAFYDAPLRLGYEGLDPQARYRVRVTYAGDNVSARMRLEADGLEVHPLIAKPNPVRPIEFDVPPQAVADGRMRLTFTREPGFGGNGRGCQVAEVWLIRAGP
jgi:hypothetical protein